VVEKTGTQKPKILWKIKLNRVFSEHHEFLGAILRFMKSFDDLKYGTVPLIRQFISDFF
jgi:hypothetical protein